jgi:hypothetical protein
MALTTTERILLAILKVLLKNTYDEDPEIVSIKALVDTIEVV